MHLNQLNSGNILSDKLDQCHSLVCVYVYIIIK